MWHERILNKTKKQYEMSLFYISLWLTLKKTRVILQDAVRLTLSIKLQNYKHYTASLETLGWAINHLPHFWKNLFAWAIYCPRAKHSLKGLLKDIFAISLKQTCLKLVSAIFYQIFIFSPNDSPFKTMENVCYFI